MSTTQLRPRHLFPKAYADRVQRYRVAGGFILLVAFAILSHPAAASIAIGLPVSAVGLLLRGWAAGHLAKDRSLAVSGPYQFMRNPLYVGTLLATAGIVIACRSTLLALIFVVVFLMVYLPAIELEEQHLGEIFHDYAQYCLRVNRFLPTRVMRSSPGSFSWTLYRRNEEYKALIGFAIAVAWLLLKAAVRR